MLSIRLYRRHISQKRIAQFAVIPQFTDDAFMSSISDHIMKIKVRNTNIVPKYHTSMLQVIGIGRRKDRFVFFRAEEINRVYGLIFFYEVREMFLEGRLRSMRSCYLYTMTEGLDTLLLPKH